MLGTESIVHLNLFVYVVDIKCDKGSEKYKQVSIGVDMLKCNPSITVFNKFTNATSLNLPTRWPWTLSSNMFHVVLVYTLIPDVRCTERFRSDRSFSNYNEVVNIFGKFGLSAHQGHTLVSKMDRSA